MTSLNLKAESRSQLFFGRYRYVIKFSVPFAFMLRGCTRNSYEHDEIRVRVAHRLKLHENSEGVFKTSTITEWRHQEKFNAEEITDALETIYDVLNNFNGMNRISYVSDSIAIYTNDKDVLTTISSLSLLCFVTAKEAIVDLPENSIFRKNNSYKYRVFFKEKKIEESIKHAITQFLKTYKEYVNPSDGLSFWIDNGFHRSERYFFFDTNSDDVMCMFDLIAPGVKRRVSRIISDKYKTEEE